MNRIKRESRLALMLLIVLPGCATRHPPPQLAATPDRSPLESWALVLEGHADATGRIDFAGLATDPESLHHFVADVAEPRATGSSPETIAFYCNAYNALAMYNVLESGKLPHDLLGFFILQKFDVGGAYYSLYDFENDVIRPLGEPRVHFALNCMVRSCPRLRREPYTAEGLEVQLDAATREFCNAEKHVRVDDENRRVELSRVMDFYTEDFLAEAPSLIAYVNRYRDEPIPEDYEVRFIKWDWTLNEQ